LVEKSFRIDRPPLSLLDIDSPLQRSTWCHNNPRDDSNPRGALISAAGGGQNLAMKMAANTEAVLA
jgi:hypothetical protein